LYAGLSAEMMIGAENNLPQLASLGGLLEQLTSIGRTFFQANYKIVVQIPAMVFRLRTYEAIAHVQAI
jgi:hypothetical protein